MFLLLEHGGNGESAHTKDVVCVQFNDILLSNDQS